MIFKLKAVKLPYIPQPISFTIDLHSNAILEFFVHNRQVIGRVSEPLCVQSPSLYSPRIHLLPSQRCLAIQALSIILLHLHHPHSS